MSIYAPQQYICLGLSNMRHNELLKKKNPNLLSKRINFSEEYPNLLSKRINFSEEYPNLLSKRINFSEEYPNLLSKRINFSEESKFTFFFLYTLIQGDQFPYQDALTLRVHPVILTVLNIACSKAHTVLCKRSTMRYPYWVFSVKSQK